MTQTLIKLWFNHSPTTNIKSSLRKQAFYNAELVINEQRYYLDFVPPQVLLERDIKDEVIKTFLLDLHKDYRKNPNFLISMPKPKYGQHQRVLNTDCIVLLNLDESQSPRSIELSNNGDIARANISASKKQDTRSPDFYCYLEIES